MENHSARKYVIQKRTGKEREKDNSYSVNSLPYYGIKEGDQENLVMGTWQCFPASTPQEQVTPICAETAVTAFHDRYKNTASISLFPPPAPPKMTHLWCLALKNFQEYVPISKHI